MQRRRPLSTMLMAAALAATSSLAGCTGGAGDAPSVTDRDGVAPLAGSAAPDDRDGTGSSGPTSPAVDDADPNERVVPVDPTDERAPDGQSTGGDTAAITEDDRLRAHTIASEVLDRYGVILTELAADAALDLGRFATRWSSIADPSSAFSRDMLDTLITRVRDDQMVIRPGADGRSYLHRPVRITTVDDDEIDFTWCGYSPGIGVHVATGDVLDDAVGHATGTGRLVRADGRWLLDTLDQDRLVALAAGSSDPCATGGDR